jgi:hypothetical protein
VLCYRLEPPDSEGLFLPGPEAVERARCRALERWREEKPRVPPPRAQTSHVKVKTQSQNLKRQALPGVRERLASVCRPHALSLDLGTRYYGPI